MRFSLFLLVFFVLVVSCNEQAKHDKVLEDATIAEVPEWAKGIVWYQIFPERFRNGDTENDPTLADQEGCWPHELIEPWEIHPWGSDWYALQEYEQEVGKDLGYNLTRRRYGGDLQGIINKLGYLQQLGIDAIYLNPVFVAPSHHKYDIANYHHIDPNFGPDPEGDRKIIAKEVPDDPSTWKWTSADKLALTLIEEVHKRDMRIIFDGVFNHVGYNHFAITDVREKQQDSKFTDWFTVLSWEDAVQSSGFRVKGWWDIMDMPELREDENGIVDGPKQYIFDITSRWMDPEGNGDLSKGIDGWRLDVAYEVAHPFWKHWRRHVRSINPEAYLVAEVIDTLLKELRDPFRRDVNLAMQNLLGSHDTDRPASRISNKGIASFLVWQDYFGIGKSGTPEYKTCKPSEEDYKVFRMMAAFQMTYPGSPMIYYGDEVGMWGAGDPDCRKPMLWEDIDYDNEFINGRGEKYSSSSVVVPDMLLLEYYRQLTAIRKKHQALKNGSFQTLLAADGVYAFMRAGGKDIVVLVVNNNAEQRKIEIKNLPSGEYINEFNAEVYNVDEGGLLIDMDGNGVAVFSYGNKI